MTSEIENDPLHTAITRLEDARKLKQMGLPVDTPVENRTFSLDYSNHWVALMNAHGEFLSAVLEYIDGARAGSPGKWRLVGRRLKALDETARRCVEFVGRLGGNALPPVFKTEQDEHEHALLGYFLSSSVKYPEAIDRQ